MKKFYITLVTFLFLAVANAQIINFTDNNFKNALINSSETTQNIKNLNGDYFKVDSNDNNEIEINEAFQVSSMDISCTNCQNTPYQISNLAGINYFTNLKNLVIYGNLISSLDVSMLSQLEVLFCQNNQMTTLNVSGLTNLYYLTCGENNLSSLNLSGLTSLTNLFCSENEITNIDFTGATNIINILCNFNQLTHLNTNELINLNYLKCNNNMLESLFIKNGKNETTLDFSNNINLKYICADLEQTTTVQNLINNYGYSTFCNLNSYCSFEPGGVFYTIQGNNKLDFNLNGCEMSDPVYPNLKFNITNGTVSGGLISNDSSYYSIPVQSGTHTITPQFENPTYFTATPTSATVTFPATTSPFTQNFCITPNGVHHDLEVVVIPVNVARPGFDATYKIKYKNKGTTSENATFNFNYNDAILDYVSSNVSPTTQVTGILSWNMGTVTPFQSGEILVTLNVNSPMETPAVNNGDVLSYTANANGLNTDETPDDNTFTLNQVVVNSFDPNDKTCLEGTTISPSNIGKYVHYKIRFENTGTFAAQNIVVKDMIDTTKFDVSTLQMTDASHSCVTRITNPNKVEFIFENINLPFDDANNDGYVVFKIKTKPTLAINSTISNSANIYFDYNFPIVTNTATSTFSVLQNDTFEFDNYFTIYPNPVDEVLNLNTKQDTEVYSLTIYNLLGQQVQTTTNPTNTVDVSSLKTGNYIVKVVTDKGVSSSKFVKE
jgi:hypothetical protein